MVYESKFGIELLMKVEFKISTFIISFIKTGALQPYKFEKILLLIVKLISLLIEFFNQIAVPNEPCKLLNVTLSILVLKAESIQILET